MIYKIKNYIQISLNQVNSSDKEDEVYDNFAHSKDEEHKNLI